MRLEKYDYSADSTLLQYEFYSNGPNGLIRKFILYEDFCYHNTYYFNLAFGDWNEKTQTLDDLSISNNADSKKVLATVASTVIDVTNLYPKHKIFAKGSTPSRTRLYQMGIFAHLNEINELFVVEGLLDDSSWELFVKGKNYHSFLISRK